MSFWNILHGKRERLTDDHVFVAEPAKIGVLAVWIAGKFEAHLFIGGTVTISEGRLSFGNVTGGQTVIAPGIWSTVQTFPLSEGCQAEVREWAKQQLFDYIAEEKIKT